MRISEKEANRLQVLKSIRRAEPIARTELTNITGLAAATITGIVADFVRLGYVLEDKVATPTGGRPRIALRLNADAACVIGALLEEDALLVVEVANLRGDTLLRHTRQLSWGPEVGSLVDEIASVLLETISEAKLERDAIHSIGLALPGIIDSERGMVRWFPPFTQEPMPLASTLESLIGIPVRIEHAADVIARAEHWFGDEFQMQDFSLVVLGLGMGFSRYIDGQVRAGAHGVNAEFSHVKFAPSSGPRCICGAAGCLMTYATVMGITAQICDLRGQSRVSARSMPGLFRKFAQSAAAGDIAALDVFTNAARYLGLAIANHINTSDPARVVVLVKEPLLLDLLAPAFHDSVRDNVLPALAGEVPVYLRPWSNSHYSRGAAALVLERLYRVVPD